MDHEASRAAGGKPSRALRERACVELDFPSATREVLVEGTRGFLFPLVSELGDHFDLFAYFDGGAYQVKVVRPRLEGADPHACHLFGDGRICFGPRDDGGVPSLKEAHARSALWANGLSVYLRTARFPF
jgi:hypothetical protein